MNSATSYARPELLVETDWLAEHRDDAGVRIIDCASQDAYKRAHIPGAVGLSVNPFIKAAKDPVHVMPPDEFEVFAASLGISNATLVITYDDNNSLNAARFWWVLNYYGHQNVKVLNGGWRKWLTEGRLATFLPSTAAPETFVAKVDDSQVCLVDDLKTRVGDGATKILDARSDEEWLGTNSRGNSRVGHVPGAVHIEWLDFVDRNALSMFKSASEIEQLLRAQGIERGPEVVTYCQGGIRAAHVAFVLRLMGFDGVRNYDGSMREWANRDDTQLLVEPVAGS